LNEKSVSRKLIESWIPLSKVNEDSDKERAPAFGRGKPPKIHNLHTYFARRPTEPARVPALVTVLPDEISSDKALGTELEVEILRIDPRQQKGLTNKQRKV